MADEVASTPEITVRPYRPEDVRRCAQLATEAWPTVIEFGETDDDRFLMQGYVEMSLSDSTWAEVALDAGNVVGFLLGSIKGQEGYPTREGEDFSWVSLIGRALSGNLGRSPVVIRALWSFVMTDLKLAINRPRSEAEIIMLIVDAPYRGYGIGKLLVDRFVSAVRDAGKTTITVYTDDQQSNWGFYEHYGFRKVSTFFDNTSSYFIGRRTNGIIYLLTLNSPR